MITKSILDYLLINYYFQTILYFFIHVSLKINTPNLNNRKINDSIYGFISNKIYWGKIKKLNSIKNGSIVHYILKI
jgi:hypothetical protein